MKRLCIINSAGRIYIRD